MRLTRALRRLAAVAAAAAALSGPAGAAEGGPAEEAKGPATLPGAAPRPPALAARLEAAYRAKGDGHVPRTEHRGPDGRARYVNRLILEEVLSRHDREHGGFGSGPKFPRAPMLLFLLEENLRRGSAEPLEAATRSLVAMARGGIHDQIGGGFHRYATDARWLVPHFEKMLYDQAWLARAYLAAHRLTADPYLGWVARQILDYVLREMTAPGGGFYSATDADSEGREGAYFVWSRTEIERVLGDDAGLALALFGVTDAGNFAGRNVLRLAESPAAAARRLSLPLADLRARVDGLRAALRKARADREAPLRDEKIITAWNGMTISALVAGADVLGEPRYLDAARRAARFVLAHAVDGAGRLLRVHLDGRSSVPALQADHAHLAAALVDLYDLTGEGDWLARAVALADTMIERFSDPEHGGFFMSPADPDTALVARPRDGADSAVPSGNSVAVRLLAALAARTGEARYRQAAEATLAALADPVTRFPSGYTYLLLGSADLAEGPSGPRQHGGQGTVAATARLSGGAAGPLRLVVDLAIREGWHVNAHRPRQKHLIPTTLSVEAGRGPWRLGPVRYPEPEVRTLGFQAAPLALYFGQTRLEAEIRWTGAGAPGPAPVVPLALRVQACSDRLCLLPETLRLEVPAALVLGDRNGTAPPREAKRASP